MDVVALEGDQVVGTGEVEGPVVMPVASSRPRGGAVDLGVRDGDTVGSLVTQHDMLTANERGLATGELARLLPMSDVQPVFVCTIGEAPSMTYLDVINPYEVGTIQSDSITTPDVLRVQICYVNVLDDDIAGTADNLQPLSFDDSGAALAHK